MISLKSIFIKMISIFNTVIFRKTKLPFAILDQIKNSIEFDIQENFLLVNKTNVNFNYLIIYNKDYFNFRN